MPRPDAAAHLASSFHRLRHPDGSERRFEIFNTFGQPEKVAAAQRLRAEHTSLAMIHELELAGFTLTHRDDPQPEPQVAQVAKIHCTHCAIKLAELPIQPDGTVALSKLAQQALAQLPTDCDDHKRLAHG